MIKSAYFRERQEYSQDLIASALQIDNAKAKQIIGKLLACNVLKLLKKGRGQTASEIINSDDVSLGETFAPSDETRYIFDFVGLLQFENFLLKCHPKYIASRLPNVEDMRLVVRSLEQYNSDQFVIRAASENEEVSYYNPLSIDIFLIRDYFSHGIYCNEKESLAHLGAGEIDWDTTIHETFPILQNGKPFYVNYYTRQTTSDENEYISRLHQCLISLASRTLKEAELDDLFSIETPELYDGELSDFGELEYIEQRILQEINVQFVTQKQIVLRAMYAIVHQSRCSTDDFGISLYGSNSFNMVWEKICSEVFSSKLHVPLSLLPITLDDDFECCKEQTLLDLIPRPQWYPSGEEMPHLASDTLTPDLISIVNANNRSYFAIMDAKYYSIELDTNHVAGQPGVGDIDKQYLYQLAFLKFIEAHGLDVVNAFLCPGDLSAPQVLGKAVMPIFNGLHELLCPIITIKLPANEMMNCYIENRHLELPSLLPQIFAEEGSAD